MMLGKEWRMPTYEEYLELIEKCTWSWSIRNGVHGYLVTSNVPGNSNSIFIPAAGGKWGEKVEMEGTYLLYWTASLYPDRPEGGWDLCGYEKGAEATANYRYAGMPIHHVWVWPEE